METSCCNSQSLYSVFSKSAVFKIKAGRKSGSISTASSDFGPSLDTESGREEIASRTAMSNALTGGIKTPSFDKETMIEEERESDAQFGETKTILEKLVIFLIIRNIHYKDIKLLKILQGEIENLFLIKLLNRN